MKTAITVDIGGTNQRIALFNENGIIGQTITYKTPSGSDADVITDRLLTEIHSFFTADILKTITAIGISAAGPVSLKKGALISPPNLPFDMVPLVKPLQKSLNKPVFLMNDCQAGVIAEVFSGAGKGYQNVVYITISTGIGGGVFLDGNPVSGHGGNAGEIGHFIIDTRYRLTCTCGYTGHWEGYCSGRGIPSFFSAWCLYHGISTSLTVESSRDIFSAAERNDATAIAFIEELGVLNATGISQVIVAYDPDIIILDGAVVLNNQNYIVPQVMKLTDRYLPLPKITVSQLNGFAPLIGAGIVALNPEILQIRLT